uniref:KCNQ_channel domain-containing protein n=1 Tax=Globodera pallida TaxID=36090 RepID=A0A183BHS1_GLOPA
MWRKAKLRSLGGSVDGANAETELRGAAEDDQNSLELAEGDYSPPAKSGCGLRNKKTASSGTFLPGLRAKLARRKFQQAPEAYDVRDVVNIYSKIFEKYELNMSGHLNMMVRIKELQRRLDQTLGKPGQACAGSGRKFHSTTLGARMTRLELQLNSIDRRMDNTNRILQ